MKYQLACLILAVAVLSGCKDKGSGGPPPAPPQVEVVAVEQRDVPIIRQWVGTLEGEVNATISAQVSGYLLSREYREGSVVTNGQVLFQIDPAPFEATLAKAKAELVEAEAHKVKTAQDVARYKPLAATAAISQQELDDAIQQDAAAAGQVASSRAAVQSAQLNLNFTTIRAPVAGLAGLASAQAQIGNLVGPATGPLTTVTQVDPIRAYFSISQQFLTETIERLSREGRNMQSGEGPPVELIMAAGESYPVKGQIRFANNQIDVKTGTVRVVAEFSNPGPPYRLVPGMFVWVKALIGTEKDALLVPQRAVTEVQGRYLVAVVGADGKVSIVPVKVGERVGSDWIIAGNVKAGDRVVAEGTQKVRDGSTVTPVPFAGKTAADAK